MWANLAGSYSSTASGLPGEQPQVDTTNDHKGRLMYLSVYILLRLIVPYGKRDRVKRLPFCQNHIMYLHNGHHHQIERDATDALTLLSKYSIIGDGLCGKGCPQNSPRSFRSVTNTPAGTMQSLDPAACMSTRQTVT
jgi:hypothetical protein